MGDVLQASDAYYSSLETGQHLDGLLGLGTTASQTHNQADALVALQQHLDLSPNSAQVIAAPFNFRIIVSCGVVVVCRTLQCWHHFDW